MKASLVVALGCLFALGCGEESDAHDHHHPDVPEEFQGRQNPLAGDADAATAGGLLYAEHCADCHGDTGRGDGPDAAEQNPPPTDFVANTLGHGDDYLYWRIAEGGLGIVDGSLMPAWKDKLTETEIWQVATFMRTFD